MRWSLSRRHWVLVLPPSPQVAISSQPFGGHSIWPQWLSIARNSRGQTMEDRIGSELSDRERPALEDTAGVVAALAPDRAGDVCVDRQPGMFRVAALGAVPGLIDPGLGEDRQPLGSAA